MAQPKRKRVYYPGCLRHTYFVPMDEYQAAQQKWLEAEQRGKDCPKCRAEEISAETHRVSVLTREEEKARRDAVNARKLALELVPSPLWGLSLKNLLPRSQWDVLRRNAYQEARYHCRICGAEGRMNAHEQWAYDDETDTQRLTGIIAICDWCHHVKHLGHSNILAREGKLDMEQVIAHYCAINGCTREEYERDSATAFEQWQERSAKLTWTTEFGEYASLMQS